MKQRFSVGGMYCAACSSRVQRTVSELQGVSSAEVNLIANSMTVEYDPALQSFDSICEAVVKAGYTAGEYTYKSSHSENNAKELKRTLKGLITSFILLFILMYFSMQHMIGYPMPHIFHNEFVMAVTQLIITVPILILNFGYFTRGFKNLFKLAPNMDSLIALGSSVSFIYSVFLLIGIGIRAFSSIDIVPADSHLYFESAAMILTLVTLGKYLEAKGKTKTGEAVESLMQLAPKTVVVLLDDNSEEERSVTSVKEGDLLVARPGDSIAVDGIVEGGISTVDTSAITGESIPREITVGDAVTGATINLSGRIVYRAQRVGEDTTIAQIIHLVEEAGGSAAPMQRLADKISLYFVPTVIAIALITAAVWLIIGQTFSYALNAAISVLVISCPCALGLATPAAIMAGIGAGAKGGVLVKSAAVLEMTHSISAVVLDKTGTITKGQPEVCDVFGDCLEIAAALESNSGHPLAKAITNHAASLGISPKAVEDFKDLPGLGVEGYIDGIHCLAGNRKLMLQRNIDVTEFSNEIEQCESTGATLLLFAANKQLIGVIGVKDAVKEDSAAAIEQMKKMGKRVIMLTGDSEATATTVASLVGVSEFRAGVLPQHKEQIVRELQSTGHRVAMIGDGINDAPALTRADVGIAIGAGTDIAIESADIVLSSSNLSDAVTAFRLGNAVMRNIKMSLFWAFFYNTAGIPIAAGVLSGLGITLNPMIAAAAMSCSSICVVLNALRLRRFKK